MVSSSGSLNYAVSTIGNIYKQSGAALSNSLIRISSGKRYLQPKDGVGEYFAIDTLSRDRRVYEILSRDLQSGLSMVTAAEDLGMKLVDDFGQLKRLASDYWAAPAGSDDRTYIDNQFNSIVAGMQIKIDSTFYGNKQLMQAGTLTSMMLNPHDLAQTFDIDFAAGDIADTTGLAADAGVDYNATLAVIDTEYNKTMSYLSKTSGYINSLESQIGVTETIISNSGLAEENMNDVNDAQQIKDLITYQIRQQASMSMMSQANMMRGAILKLFE